MECGVKKIVLSLLVVPFMFAGCLMWSGPGGGVTVVPFLPPVVVLGEEPYYVHEGYHYHYRNEGWYYANSRNGPWSALPRDHYPREVRFRNGRGERDGQHGR